MLDAIGARGTVVPAPTPLTGYTVAPRYVVHQHGTMRMGRSPKDSVVDQWGRFWEVPNLFVADGSLFTTAGGYNPTHTIEALAHRVADHIATEGAGLLLRPASAVAAAAVTGLPNTTSSTPGAATMTALATAATAGAAGAVRRMRHSDGDSAG